MKALDYAFQGVPAEAMAGTRFTLTNTSAVEVHELVAVLVPDGERRPPAELVRDQAGLGRLMGSGPPAAVVIAAPSSSTPGANPG